MTSDGSYTNTDVVRHSNSHTVADII